MLNQGNKYLLLLLCSICLFSCADKSKKMQEEWLLYKDYSSQLVSQELYEQVLQEANDSVKNWLSNNLSNYLYEKNNDWRLDSLLCFNKNIDKCIMTLMLRDTLYKPTNSDGISHFYGIKIRNTWYFFRGAHMVVPREFYQEDIHTPLSFEKLKQIATSNIYRGYLKKGKKGQWEINERFFDQVIPLNHLQVRNNKLRTEEEYVKFMIEVNWSSDVNETIRKYNEE
jgi:hypothetical protein